MGVVPEMDSDILQIIAIVITDEEDALVADGHLDGVDLVGGEDGILGYVDNGHRDGEFLFVGVVERQRQPEGSGKCEEE